MKFVERIVMIILITAVVLLFTFPLIFAEVLNISSGNKSSIEVMVDNIVDTVKNGKKYDKYAKEYLQNEYGEVISSQINMSRGERVDSNKYAFTLRLNGLLSKSFILYVRSDGICYDNLSEVISTDKKFQHLYSEWVKKQVGIEDENVELKFSEARFWSRSFGKPYIDFSKITNLDNIEEQICKNTKNIYILSNYYDPGIIITIDNTEDIKTLLNYTDIIEKKIHFMIFINKENSNYKNKKNNVLYIKLIDKSNEDYIDVMYNYDDNSRFYRYKTNNSEWIKYE